VQTGCYVCGAPVCCQDCCRETTRELEKTMNPNEQLPAGQPPLPPNHRRFFSRTGFRDGTLFLEWDGSVMWLHHSRKAASDATMDFNLDTALQYVRQNYWIEAVRDESPADDAERKIVCHAPGERCHGCPHYHGNSEACKFAPTDNLETCTAGSIQMLQAFGELSDTPETEAQVIKDEWQFGVWVKSDFARSLERQRNEAREKLVEAKPWMLFFRDDKTLGEVADECGGTVYDYTFAFTQACGRVSADDREELSKVEAKLKLAVEALEKSQKVILMEHVANPDNGWAEFCKRNVTDALTAIKAGKESA